MTKLITLLCLLSLATPALADPIVAGELLPRPGAKYVTDLEIIKKLDLDPSHEPVWCYNGDANAILITAPEREREKCALLRSQDEERLSLEFKLRMDTLTLENDTLKRKHQEILSIKNREIEELTQAALNRPGDYKFWWATGGAAVGILGTLLIITAVAK